MKLSLRMQGTIETLGTETTAAAWILSHLDFKPPLQFYRDKACSMPITNITPAEGGYYVTINGEDIFQRGQKRIWVKRTKAIKA